jgi:uncharacterized membrane protein YkoI
MPHRASSLWRPVASGFPGWPRIGILLPVFFATLAVGSVPLVGATVAVTITAAAPIETLAPDGSVSGVSMAAPGTHYTLVTYTAVGARGVPVVTLIDSQKQQYEIDMSATDYKPGAAATPAPDAGPTAPSTKPGTLDLATLPPAVQKTVQANLNGRTIGDITRDTDDGAISYDIEMKSSSQNSGITVAQDGQLLRVETTLAEVPPAVGKAIQAALGSGKLGEIDKLIDSGETTYVAAVTTNGQEHDLTFQEDGTLADAEVDLNEVPPAVQAAIKNLVANDRLDEIDRTVDDGETAYTASIISNGKEHDATFKEDGTLTDQEMEMSDLPLPVQTAINAITENGKLQSLERSTENGETTYIADMNEAGQDRSYTFTEDGTLSNKEMAMADLPPVVQSAVKGVLAQGKLGDIEMSVDPDDGTTYAVTISKGGQDRDYTFSDTGTLLSQEVALAEVPPAVQATIATMLGTGKVTQIDLSFDDGGRSFEVEGNKDGQEIDFDVGPRGKLLGADN